MAEEDENDTPGMGDPAEGEGDESKDEKPDADPNAGLKSALAKERAAAKQLAKELAALKAQNETDAQKSTREQVEKAREDAEKTWRPRVISYAAEVALSRAGCTKPERLLKLIDDDSIEIDDDGKVSGIEGQIKALKKDFPELFPARSGGARDVDAGDRGGKADGKPKSSAERIAAMMLGGS